MKTEFLTPRQKQLLIEGVNEEDKKELYRELDRLENRIRQLELSIENLEFAFNKTVYTRNKYFNR